MEEEIHYLQKNKTKKLLIESCQKGWFIKIEIINAFNQLEERVGYVLEYDDTQFIMVTFLYQDANKKDFTPDTADIMATKEAICFEHVEQIFAPFFTGDTGTSKIIQYVYNLSQEKLQLNLESDFNKIKHLFKFENEDTIKIDKESENLEQVNQDIINDFNEALLELEDLIKQQNEKIIELNDYIKLLEEENNELKNSLIEFQKNSKEENKKSFISKIKFWR